MQDTVQGLDEAAQALQSENPDAAKSVSLAVQGFKDFYFGQVGKSYTLPFFATVDGKAAECCTNPEALL